MAPLLKYLTLKAEMCHSNDVEMKVDGRIG